MTSLEVQKSAQVSVLPKTGGLDTLVGNTPLLPLNKIASDLPDTVQIMAKAEWFNPGGSIKDRPALNIIRTAIAEGQLDGGRSLLDATSGNTGIAYATFGAVLGIPVTLTLPGNASPERIAILRALGAELILTDASEGTDGAIRMARKMVAEQPERYFHANQYDNPANWLAHYYSTGPEIIQQTAGRVTHFVACMGTAGTLMGIGRYLREYNPDIEIIAGQPDTPFHGIEGVKHMKTAIRPKIFDPKFPDRTIEISTEEAYGMVRRLGREEGMFVGISAGASVLAATQIARELAEQGKPGLVVTVMPDAGYKYLSDKKLWV